MTDEAKVAAYVSGVVLDALWQQFRESAAGDEDALDREYAEWKAVAVATVEALPVTERDEEWRQEEPETGRDLLTAMAGLIAAVIRLATERDAARDLAFRAAFADEEGAEVEWGVEFPGGGRSFGDENACRQYLSRHADAHLTRRYIGPWQPVTP